MATLLIFLLFILACICSFFRFKKWSVAAFVAAMLGFVVIGTGFAPSFLLSHLQSSISLPNESAWGNKNAIVLLGGGAIKGI